MYTELALEDGSEDFTLLLLYRICIGPTVCSMLCKMKSDSSGTIQFYTSIRNQRALFFRAYSLWSEKYNRLYCHQVSSAKAVSI